MKDVDFIAPHTLDPQRYVDNHKGVYLDEEKRKQSEIFRAKAEGREPDLENPPADTGTPLYTEQQLTTQGANLAHLKDAHVETLPVSENKDKDLDSDDESEDDEQSEDDEPKDDEQSEDDEQSKDDEPETPNQSEDSPTGGLLGQTQQ